MLGCLKDRLGSLRLMGLVAVAERTKTLLCCGFVACLAAGSLLTAAPVGASSGYGDVDADGYFARAVQWSVDNNIITADEPCFFPGAPVTRGDAAVSLWNMENRPSAPVHRFADVGYDQSLSGAVSWMAESKITTGTSRLTFSPDAQATRGEVAAYLHRLAGRPHAPRHRFSDVASAWMHAPVSWMAAQGITTGVSTEEFAPDKPLTRAELVTFLYRYKGQPAVAVDPSTERCCLRISADADPCGLSAELGRLVEVARDWDRTVEVAASVILHDGSVYGVNANEPVPSASAVKPVWAAAAIDVAGLEEVLPFAPAALVRSDNRAAGELIDLAGGIDALNAWSRDVAGLEDTHLSGWRIGSVLRRSSTARGLSQTTTSDLAQFYARLYQGEFLAQGESAQLMNWLRSTTRRLAYVEGAIVDRLPEPANSGALQKLGWLPPGGGWSTGNALVGGALVPVGDGEWFAIALSSTHSTHYTRAVKWFGLAACRVYAVVAGDPAHDCGRGNDPAVTTGD